MKRRTQKASTYPDPTSYGSMAEVPPGELDEILAAYRFHPVRKEPILARLSAYLKTGNPLTEMDLASDPTGSRTDQNHVGGVESVLAMAERVGISAADRVLDIGCGIGGPARILAHFYKCRIDGIDLSPERYSDAVTLTKLVGLSNHVSFLCGDFLSESIESGAYTVVWGQNGWTHFRDKATLFDRCRLALVRRGRIAIEETCLLRPPNEHWPKVNALEKIWHCRFVAQQDWESLLNTAGFKVTTIEDLSATQTAYYLRLIMQDKGDASSLEREGWTYAADLGRSGILGYVRIIGSLQEHLK